MARPSIKKTELIKRDASGFKAFLSNSKNVSCVDFDAEFENETHITTDYLALNAIMSGDITKGVPKHQITMFAGVSGSGKSLMIKAICNSAINNSFTKSSSEVENIIKQEIKEKLITKSKEEKWDSTKKDSIDTLITNMCVSKTEIKKRLQEYKDPSLVTVLWWDCENAFEDKEEMGSYTSDLKEDEKFSNVDIPLENFCLMEHLMLDEKGNITNKITEGEFKRRRKELNIKLEEAIAIGDEVSYNDIKSKIEVLSKSFRVMPWTIESWAASVRKVIAEIEMYKRSPEFDGREQEYIFVLDSFQCLVTLKEHMKSAEGVQYADMGLRAKVWGAQSKPLTDLFKIYNITLLGVNGVYDNPNDLYKSFKPNLANGNAVKYIPQRIMYLKTTSIKHEGVDTNGITNKNKYYAGNNIKVINYKNRKVIDGTMVDMISEPGQGLNPYADILSLVPNIFVPTNAAATEVKFKWFMNIDKKTFKEMYEELAFNVIDVDVPYRIDVDKNGNFIVIVDKLTKSLYSSSELKKYFSYDKDADGSIILTPIETTYKKSELYKVPNRELGETSFFDNQKVLEMINDNLKWMQLNRRYTSKETQKANDALYEMLGEELLGEDKSEKLTQQLEYDLNNLDVENLS